VVRREIARFVVNRLAPADFRSVAYLGPPYAAFGVWRHLARYRITPKRSGHWYRKGTEGSEQKISPLKIKGWGTRHLPTASFGMVCPVEIPQQIYCQY
jgi:hypothetical protein